ncbi:MLN64 N-terminal domain homolog [Pelobates cultripes]|uniref:MLN64 N-terminal domain homolog n=1 Tax=Pelobates cultripes TaxID=61616 RepID=A0AAD1RXS3_PELCU|nr:MLN64 N-terminal domain homolog [Pelobates cultripes]
MMNHQSDDVPCMQSSLLGSHSSVHEVQSINSAELVARLESYEGSGKKGISDVRRTFCLFATFDLLFVTLLWIIELNTHGILDALQREVLQYDYYTSFFDIFLLSVFRFSMLIIAYAMCKLRHWWAVAITTSTTCAFLLVKVILSKVCYFLLKHSFLFVPSNKVMHIVCVLILALLSRCFWLCPSYHVLHSSLDRSLVS